MKSKRIGFFGGCFNPPSKIHINIANKLLEENKLDEIIFVPVGDFYPKKGLIEGKHRYNMLKLSIKDYDNLKVDDMEINTKRNLYATEVFELIQDKYKENEIYYIMGSDNFQKMPTWKNYNEIIKKYKYLVLERKKDMISSTEIRKMLKQEKDMSDLLYKDVIDYIKKYNLYEI